jgi:putative selenium metabolism hydrolase
VPKDPTFENALALARELVRIPSLSGQEGEVARRVLTEMEDLGFEQTWADDLGNVIGVIPGVSGGAPVMLNCHLDVVAEGDHRGWEYPPFSGAVEGDFLHGRGSMDIKGPLAVQTYAAAALRGRAPGDVIVAHTVFEERGGWGMEYLMESKGVEPAAVIIGEATRGDITVGHRGRAEIEIVLRGRAAHASAPERGQNPLDFVPAALGAMTDLASRQEEDPVLGPASLVATAVDVLPESRNVIPDEVVLVGDWRVLPGDSDESLLARMEETLRRTLPELPEGMGAEVRMAREVQETYTGVREERDLFTPGFLVDPQDPLVVAAAKAVGRRQDTSRNAEIRPWTFATDGGWSCGVFGIPTIGFAPGDEAFAHTNRERLDLEETRWAFSRYPELILALQAMLA